MSIAVVMGTPSAMMDAGHTVFTSSEGYRKAAAFVVSIFSFMSDVVGSTTPRPLKGHLQTFVELTSIVALFQRANGWKKNESGNNYAVKDGAYRPFEEVSGMVFLTASNLVTFLTSMDSLKLINLGKRLSPLNKLNDLLLVAICVTNLWSIVKSIPKQIENYNKEKMLRHNWKALNDGAVVNETAQIKAAAETLIRNYQSISKDSKEVAILNEIKELKFTQAGIKTYAERKLACQDAAYKNAMRAIGATLVNIAFDVAAIAMVTLSMVVGGPAAVITTLSLSVYGFDFVDFFLNNYFNYKSQEPDAKLLAQV